MSNPKWLAYVSQQSWHVQASFRKPGPRVRGQKDLVLRKIVAAMSKLLKTHLLIGVLCNAACSHCPEDVRRSLVAVLEQGVGRSVSCNLPDSAAGARFPQLCLRKLYVISSRGGAPGHANDCLEEVS